MEKETTKIITIISLQEQKKENPKDIKKKCN